MKKKVNYICFFSEPEDKDVLVSYPSVWSKIDYIKNVLIESGYNIEIISTAFINKRGVYKGHVSVINSLEKHRFFNSFKTGIRILDKLNIAYMYVQLFICLLAKSKSEYILVYHSLFYDKVIKFINKVYGRQFILEIEDVYSSLNKKTKKFSEREWRYFELPSAYLIVNDIIADKIKNGKDKIISYGRYQLPEWKRKDNNYSKIRLIYAGVIERERRGAFLAVESMRYLPDNYELFICGFGSDDDIDALQNEIEQIKNESKRNLITYLGYKYGEEYEYILQHCDIALSTHVYDDTNMDSADHTFPSKLLVYLANGLQVVAQRLQVLEKSELSELIFFYDCPIAENVAQTILNIDLHDKYNGRRKIKELDENFKKNLNELLRRLNEFPS